MDIQLIVRKLLEYDPEIVEIVQFGSSVYAPEHARDLDLLIITGSIRERDLRGEFYKWFRRVEEYISSLESKVKSR